MAVRPAAALVAALVLLLGTAVPVHADSINDKQREAAALATRINDLEDRIAQLGEQYDQALLQSSQLDQEVHDAEARLAAKDAQLQDLHKQLAEFALSRYTSGNDPNSLATLAAGPSLADGAVQREGYAQLALGVNEDVTDELGAATQDATRQRDALAAKRDRQQQLAALVSDRKQAAEDASVQLDSTLKSVKADIADLVQKEQERQAAEAARQQQERLAAEAAKAEAARRAAATSTTAAPAVRSGVGQAVPAPPPTTSPRRTVTPRASAPVPDVPATSAGAAVAVRAALSQLGVPYQFGQATPGVAFDCSGLTMYAWGQAGVSLPHSSQAQYDMLPKVPLDQIQPGDLVFSHTPVGHVGIYIGNGQMVHAPMPGDVVKVSPVSPNAIGAGRPG